VRSGRSAVRDKIGDLPFDAEAKRKSCGACRCPSMPFFTLADDVLFSAIFYRVDSGELIAHPRGGGDNLQNRTRTIHVARAWQGDEIDEIE
jgi:hypothetical protein